MQSVQLGGAALPLLPKSFVSMGEGGLEMWEDAKTRSLGTVTVKTDDMEITLGHLLRQTLKTIVVATLTPTRHSIESQETGRRYRCQVFQIARNRLTEFTARN